MEKADVVLVKDFMSSIYVQAKRLGILCAPPLWLERCFTLRRCVPIAGDLQVGQPKTLSLVGSAGETTCPGQAVSACSDPAKEGDSGTSLLFSGCVICLLYLPEGLRNHAKALAWTCGAYTTLDPLDKGITHVLFANATTESLATVSIQRDDDRVSFLDIQWLEACVRDGRRVRESSYPLQRVHHNPACDSAYTAVSNLRERKLQRGPSRCPSVGAQPLPWESALAPVPLPAPLSPERGPGTAAAAIEGVPQALAHAPEQPFEKFAPETESGVFAGLTLGLHGWPSGDADGRALVSVICGQGGTATSGGSPEQFLEADVCICRRGVRPAASEAASRAQLATAEWVRACVSDGVRHPCSEFPHFEPCAGQLPLPDMGKCLVRITSLEEHGRRKRARLEELAQLLGARVAQKDSKFADITHVVAVVPKLLDRKTFDGAKKRRIPVVEVQWLFDCYSRCKKQPAEPYSIDAHSSDVTDQLSPDHSRASARQFAAAVLAGHDVLISLSALGSDARLPKMAEELGAAPRTWRSAHELREALEACGAWASASAACAGASDANGSDAGSKTNHRVVVLLDEEEARGGNPGAPLAEFIAALPGTARKIFVLPTWLLETFRQRRPLPLEAFAALPARSVEEPSKKRPREDVEATYAWKSAASTLLDDFAKDSKAKAMQSKAQEKEAEGLRLAQELQREPPRLGA
eukprot:gnl/TRDRNA2_/TRDRNA2_86310_c2_seq1.p1 gnl/TRDRNA2_/TRDRNA2_86310_c2~~gnl/TRDRNA2_/TRDRNA2_86310_c2_seq1.p1  ORF type:complete len:695 (+),score=110.39 gnl/TRDRNA2_/TRDRNA2_86310_c2_seq1:1-2085(+)